MKHISTANGSTPLMRIELRRCRTETITTRAVRKRLPGQPGGDLGDPFLDVLDRRQGIVSVADDDHAADRFGALLVQRTPAQGRAERDLGNVFDIDGNVVADLDDGLLDVSDSLDEAQTADDVFHPINLDGPRADVDVGHLDGPNNLTQCDPVRSHGVRVDVHLVLLHEPADRRHFGNAFSREERVSHVPVLNRSQLLQVPPAGRIALRVAPLQGVPEDLAQGGRFRAERGTDAFRQRARRQAVEFGEDAIPRRVNVHLLLEDHVDG